jgi:hypothetical protein
MRVSRSIRIVCVHMIQIPNPNYLFKHLVRSMWHDVRFPIQPRLVRAFLRIPLSLVCIGRREKEELWEERSESADYLGLSWVMRLGVNGDLRYFNELVEIYPRKLACDFVAHLLHSHTFWLPIT